MDCPRAPWPCNLVQENFATDIQYYVTGSQVYGFDRPRRNFTVSVAVPGFYAFSGGNPAQFSFQVMLMGSLNRHDWASLGVKTLACNSNDLYVFYYTNVAPTKYVYLAAYNNTNGPPFYYPLININVTTYSSIFRIEANGK
jgi:hypothetical protein